MPQSAHRASNHILSDLPSKNRVPRSLISRPTGAVTRSCKVGHFRESKAAFPI
jgi:hypothetical protein